MATAATTTNAGTVTAIMRAWVTGPLDGDQGEPVVCVRRIEEGWQVALVRGDLQTRARFRHWITLLPPLHCQYERTVGAWWVSEWGMGQLTRGRHPFGLLLGDARRAIVANSGTGR